MGLVHLCGLGSEEGEEALPCCPQAAWSYLGRLSQGAHPRKIKGSNHRNPVPTSVHNQQYGGGYTQACVWKIWRDRRAQGARRMKKASTAACFARVSAHNTSHITPVHTRRESPANKKPGSAAAGALPREGAHRTVAKNKSRGNPPRKMNVGNQKEKNKTRGAARVQRPPICHIALWVSVLSCGA